MEKIAPADHYITSLIANRWSPRAYDPTRPVDLHVLATLFEAARWAPSNGNEQPWRFIVGVNFDECHQEILSTISEGNQRWAKNASVLLIAAAKTVRGDRPYRHAFHDLGLATENLFLQAYDLGLYCHFMGGFSPDKARETFGIPREYEPMTAAAIGYPGNVEDLPDDLRERELAPRERKPLKEVVFTGQWDTALAFPNA